MGIPSSEVLESIPQKEPFLFVDAVIESEPDYIKTNYRVTGGEDFFKGHFPGNPVMPGVILQEALFQSGALLMSKRSEEESSGLGVVTRVNDVKFRGMVKPGCDLTMEVKLLESIGNAYIMSGKTMVDGKTVAALKFTVASV